MGVALEYYLCRQEAFSAFNYFIVLFIKRLLLVHCLCIQQPDVARIAFSFRANMSVVRVYVALTLLKNHSVNGLVCVCVYGYKKTGNKSKRVRL